MLSRAAFSIEKNIPFSIVPVIDCFNHRFDSDARGQCELIYNLSENTFIVSALTPASPGDQLFISYGQHGNAELLSRYGFVLDDNPYETTSVDTPAGKFVISKESTEDLPTNSAFASNLAKQLETVLESYGTSIDEDTSLLENIERELEHSFSQALYAKKCAVVVRLGEKRLLKRDIRRITQETK